ncbi:MAG: family 20 glycosylhydrolase, partial [Clostridia bacterium]|nr:family 20 glycosylhydrolase [Clostridia bacterium]
MIFHPQNLIKKAGSLVFSGEIDAIAHPCLNKDIIKDFWNNFTFQSSTLSICESKEFIFSIGSTQPLSLDDCDYSINVDPDGICICAENEKNLIRGYMTLLDRFHAVDHKETLAVELACCQIKDKPMLQNRMVHFCVFPETEIWELQRFLRLCGALKYTHVALEFWGMLNYDCMKELSWSHGFTKEQIAPLIREANDLGIEIIPMFNHWGHASAGRVMHGKHVVLDQNPALQTYFSDDGWCWDIRNPKVRKLLRQIREELIELCGQGEYFHIGCDEAYNFEVTEENMDLICDYINGISEEMRVQKRRVIVWGDMILYRHSHYNPNNK